MGTLVQSASQTGGFFTSRTETFSACIPGSLMLLFGTTNENDGIARTFDSPGAGWNVIKAFRQTGSILNTICYGRYAAGGETSAVLGYTATTGRLQTAFMELQGYYMVGGTAAETTSSFGTGSAVSATDSGTCTPGGSGRLFVAWNSVKNADPLTESGGFSSLTVNNEGGATSTQKITSGMFYSLSRSTASREQASYSAITATNASIGVMFLPTQPSRSRIAVSRAAWAGR